MNTSKKVNKGDKATRGNKPSVAVLGAGVAGLTAAQELAERGYAVTVYSPGDVLGGMARSQPVTPPKNEQTEDVLFVRSRGGLRSRLRGDGTVPGEHGFHFFPSFYRHVVDTMSRITYLDEKGRATGRTVEQNLVATTQQGVVDGGVSTIYERERVSPEVLLKELEATLGTPGITTRDLAVFGAKVFEYMTSCAGRRKGYEEISAWDYLGGDRFNAQFGGLVDRVPQLLVSMRAKECDARTYGNVATQLALDQLRRGKRTDRTLNAPSSDAWFDPWRRYLKSRGVTFADGTLTKIGTDGSISVKTAKGVMTPDCDYAVVAVPLEVAKHLVTPPLAAKSETLRRIHDFPATEALRWMSGIQYYFLEQVNGDVRGHVVYEGAAWGLSSISQSQFWSAGGDGGEFPTPEGLVCGVVSVDIANWDVPANDPKSKVKGKTARQCTKDEIAEEVWLQMTSDLEAMRGRRVVDGTHVVQRLRARYAFYHLDDDVLFASETKPPTGIVAQILINLPRAWEARPGDPGSYEVSLGKLVFAGTYMKTYTRLTTTEAANESARHAVNAILSKDDYTGDHCSTWNMEDSEDDSLTPLVELDAVLFKHRQPHWMRTARVIDTLETLLPRNPNGTGDTGGFSRGDARQVVDAIELALRSANLPSPTAVARHLVRMIGLHQGH